MRTPLMFLENIIRAIEQSFHYFYMYFIPYCPEVCLRLRILLSEYVFDLILAFIIPFMTLSNHFTFNLPLWYIYDIHSCTVTANGGDQLYSSSNLVVHSFNNIRGRSDLLILSGHWKRVERYQSIFSILYSSFLYCEDHSFRSDWIFQS